MPKAPWLSPSSPLISDENNEMKKVWPSDEQKAIAMPNSRKRHSTRMKSNVATCIGEADGSGSERGWVMAAISPRAGDPGKSLGKSLGKSFGKSSGKSFGRRTGDGAILVGPMRAAGSGT